MVSHLEGFSQESLLQECQPPAGLPVLEFGNPFNQSQATEGYNMTA